MFHIIASVQLTRTDLCDLRTLCRTESVQLTRTVRSSHTLSHSLSFGQFWAPPQAHRAGASPIPLPKERLLAPHTHTHVTHTNTHTHTCTHTHTHTHTHTNTQPNIHTHIRQGDLTGRNSAYLLEGFLEDRVWVGWSGGLDLVLVFGLPVE